MTSNVTPIDDGTRSNKIRVRSAGNATVHELNRITKEVEDRMEIRAQRERVQFEIEGAILKAFSVYKTLEAELVVSAAYENVRRKFRI